MIHAPGLFIDPIRQWTKIRDQDPSPASVFFSHTLIFALIAPICGYYGTTVTGWSFGGGAAVRLTPSSALQISVLYYLATLVTAVSVAATIKWMSSTYGASISTGKALALASYSATPLFLVGFVELWPILWVNLIAGLPALAFTIYLFYTGVPIVLDIPKERGFLLSSAMMGFGLVALVALLASTALLWGFGVMPQFA